MTEETVKRLDYSRPPPGYEVGNSDDGDGRLVEATGAAAWPHWAWNELSPDLQACGETLTRVEAVTAAWAHFKAENDPLGMETYSDDGAEEHWCFAANATVALHDAPYHSRVAARAAAWAWHDRRHALARMFEQTAEIMGRPAFPSDPDPAWADMLTWSDEQVAAAEREVAAMIHRHAEKRAEEVLRA